MLRLSRILSTAVAAGALFVSYPAFAQAGLGQRLDAKEQELSQAEQTCREVNLAEYAQLLEEAVKNKQRADKAAKKGIPVNQAQVDADLAKAMMLFARAQMAQARQCMMQAQQQQAQPQPSPPAPQTGQAPAPTPGAQGTGGLDSQLADAEKKLDEDVKACRPIKPEDIQQYGALREQAERNYKAARKSQNAGLPIELNKVLSDWDRARSLLERATQAQAKQAICPPKREAQTEPPPPAAPKQTSMNLPRWAQDMLAAHNAARAAVGSPPLNWDPVLQEHATARAQEMAQSRQLTHAPREGRGTERENILEAPLGYSPAQMIQVWTGESRHFVPGIFPNVSDTGNWMDVAHYTQVVSYLSTDLGCGFAEGGGFNWLVCRYNPGGNKDGKPVLATNSEIRPRLIGGNYAGDGDPNAPDAIGGGFRMPGAGTGFNAASFRNGAVSISASVRTTAGTTKVTTTVTAVAPSEPKGDAPAGKAQTSSVSTSGPLGWSGGDVTVRCTPIFFPRQGTAIMASGAVSSGPNSATPQGQGSYSHLTQAEIDSLRAEYGEDVNVGMQTKIDQPPAAQPNVDTKVEQPKLPSCEVFTPQPQPQSPLEQM